MPLLIIVPGTVEIDGFIELPVYPVQHFSVLVSLEEAALRLVTQSRHLLSIAVSRCKSCSLHKSAVPPPLPTSDALRAFGWPDLFSSQHDPVGLLAELTAQAACLEGTLKSKRTERGCDNAANGIEGAHASTTHISIPAEYALPPMLFIDCLYIYVPQHRERPFRQFVKQLVSPECLERLSGVADQSVYRIFCLKTEAEQLLSRIGQQQYRCCVHSAVRCDDGCGADGQHSATEQCALLSGELAECRVLWLKTLWYAAYIEAMHRYGPLATYKYKLADYKEKQIGKELRKIKRTLSAQRVVDSVSDDADEYPFTHVRFDYAE